jgi:hypothetical protein
MVIILLSANTEAVISTQTLQSIAGNQGPYGCKQRNLATYTALIAVSSLLISDLLLDHEDGGGMLVRNAARLSTGLDEDIVRQRELAKMTAERTSSPSALLSLAASSRDDKTPGLH